MKVLESTVATQSLWISRHMTRETTGGIYLKARIPIVRARFMIAWSNRAKSQ